MKKTTTLITILAALSMASCAREFDYDAYHEQVNKAIDPNLFIQGFGYIRADKIYVDKWGQLIMLKDLDDDGSYDLRAVGGHMPGAYAVMIKKGYENRLGIWITDSATINAKDYVDTTKNRKSN